MLIGIGLDEFAALAAKALEPKPADVMSLAHMHAPGGERPRAGRRWSSTGCAGPRTMTFRALCGDSPDTLTTVARFLALLELFREGAVGFDQVTPLGELTVRWTGRATTSTVDADAIIRRVRGRPSRPTPHEAE